MTLHKTFLMKKSVYNAAFEQWWMRRERTSVSSENIGVNVMQAPCDADTSIVKEAVNRVLGKKTVDNVEVMSDVLCLPHPPLLKSCVIR